MSRRFKSFLPAVPVGLTIGVFLGALALSGCTTAYEDDGGYEQSYVDEEPAPADEFDELSYWGQWFDLYPYGQVWRPTVVMEWRPYANGQWVWSDMGWTWLSYEPFGWATYHYGTWAYDFAWGWVWVPGYDWHPACVEWVVYDDYIAWAPLPPPGFAIHDPWTQMDYDCWHVVQIDHFSDPDVARYYVKYKDRAQVQDRSLVKYKAPPLTVVEKSEARTLRPVKIELVSASTDGRVKRLKLPPDEAKEVQPYRERIEKKLREDVDSGKTTRSIRKERPTTEPGKKPAVERPKQPVKKKRTTRAKKEKPAGKNTGQKEPEKKKKKEPEKREPQKKEPRKKEPVKKPVKEKPTKRPRKG
jgi:hypothetical protein